MLLAAGGKRARNELPVAGAARPRRARRPAPRAPAGFVRRGTPNRGPGGKFVPGVYHPGGVAVDFFDPVTGLNERRVQSAGLGKSTSARVKAVRAQRRVVLNALKEARARGLRDGTIKRLKAASKQLLIRSKLTRGL